ncbi:MAG TPA: hypothetical protein VHS78_17840 [Candidatus Elarobacter sp.]|nr:hypothetical protein [Candidatus Elarobacter sp.]
MQCRCELSRDEALDAAILVVRSRPWAVGSSAAIGAGALQA